VVPCPLARWADTLRRPKRALIVDVPIELDDGRIAHFEGYRVQHNLSRGPGKRGVRYHPDVTLEEVMALAARMSNQERGRQPALRRRQGRCPGRSEDAVGQGARAHDAPLHQRVGIVIGPQQDIPAPDVNTNPQIMARMMDTYSMNVGAAAAEHFVQAGAKIVAVQDHSGTVVNDAGLDLPALLAWMRAEGSVAGFPGGGRSSRPRVLLGCALRHPDPGGATGADHRRPGAPPACAAGA
jgi:glutamate dehydrogenase/leucine dehydrogenase